MVAERLFVERGYAGTTVDTVAATAGEARSTIFEQIGRKIDVLILVAIDADARARAAIKAERIAARSSARRRRRGDVRVRSGALLPPAEHEVAASRAARTALLRHSETARLAPALGAARDAGERQAVGLLRQWDAARRQTAAAALRRAGRPLTPGGVAGLAALSGPGPYLSLVVDGRWLGPQYEHWLAETLGQSLRPG